MKKKLYIVLFFVTLTGILSAQNISGLDHIDKQKKELQLSTDENSLQKNARFHEPANGGGLDPECYVIDIGIGRVESPSGVICLDSLKPTFDLINFGQTALTSAWIYWDIDSTFIRSFYWTGNLGPMQSEEIRLDEEAISLGSHILTIVLESPNGQVDSFPANNFRKCKFEAIPSSSGQGMPFIEDFNLTNWPPQDWLVMNPDNGITWQLVTNAGYNSSSSVMMNNYNYMSAGEKDELVLPIIDLSGVDHPVLKWEMAYVLYSNLGYSDTLKVHVSSDCGKSWDEVYINYGVDMVTTSFATLQTAFFPGSDSEWKTQSVDLSDYSDKDGMLIKFINITDYENNLFIDDIRFEAYTTALEDVTADDFARIFPNPATEQLNIQWNGANEKEFRVQVINATGQVVLEQEKVSTLSGPTVLNVNDLTSGIYWLKITGKQQNLSKKFIKN